MAQSPFPGGKRPYFKKNFNTAKHRKNERIRALEIRVIGPEGNQLGILKTSEAIKLAKAHELDLVEISPTAKPPVCRILDYGKFLYQESKKSKSNKSQATKLKEVKFGINTDSHDYETKMRRAEEFLFKGNKVKVTLAFRRGRDLARKDFGFEKVKQAVEDLNQIATPDNEARLVGKMISVTLSPLPPAKRKLKFTRKEEHDENDVSEETE